MSVFVILFFLFIVGFLAIPSYKIRLLKVYALSLSFMVFWYSLFLLWFFNSNTLSFQYYDVFNWLSFVNLYWSVGVDGLSIFFIILTALLIPFTILCSWHAVKYRVKEFLFLLLFVELLLINFFITLDLLFFYIFFESLLIPLFFIIGVWGSRQRKIHAVYQFFFYTLAGSLVLLLGIFVIYFHAGSTDIEVLYQTSFSNNRQLLLWLAFFIPFAVKVPMVPVHLWLPEAHVEAPTAGSVLLAGVLLKLGTYGFLRFSLPLFPFACSYFLPLVYTMTIIALVYTSATTLRQIDLKKIIAYSSVAQMNFLLLGLFSSTIEGVEGSLFLMLSHGLVSSGLFLLIGILYDRYKSRILFYYGGIVQLMPLWSMFFFLFILANLSFPGTSNFIGELLVLMGLIQKNTIATLFASTTLILGAAYCIWCFNRIAFGEVGSIQYFGDLTRREFFIMFPLLLLVALLGFFPNLVFANIHMNCYDLIFFGV